MFLLVIASQQSSVFADRKQRLHRQKKKEKEREREKKKRKPSRRGS
jgi:hypothetical protein